MRSTFSNKDIDIDGLVDKISDFFTSLDFRTFVKKSDSCFSIAVGFDESKHNKTIVKVTVEASADGSTTVVFDNLLNADAMRSSPFSLIGAGFWTLGKLKGAEVIDRLEKDFWTLVDSFVGSV
jgi:hypothetical protein